VEGLGAAMEEEKETVMVTPGEVLGRSSDVKAGRGAYAALHNNTVYASLTGFRRTIPPPPDCPDQVGFRFPLLIPCYNQSSKQPISAFLVSLI